MYERTVISRHALRNALLPAITVIGIEFAFLIGGLVVTEQVFNLNGIGKLFVQSVSRSDFTLIQGMVMMLAVAYVVVNLVVDPPYARCSTRASVYGRRHDRHRTLSTGTLVGLGALDRGPPARGRSPTSRPNSRSEP